MYCPGADMTLISTFIGAEPEAASYVPTELAQARQSISHAHAGPP